MTRIFLKMAALLALSMLVGCVDPSDLPYLGGRPGYQRGIDQDIEATHDSGAATLGNESPVVPANWR